MTDAVESGNEGDGGRETYAANCPSVLDVARFESGDLNEAQRATVIAHARQCARCGLSVAELREARKEILGGTADISTVRSLRAAEEIATILRLRLH
ncbi:MAG: hypothetical protein ABUS79_04305 [Pseudomonadota bacterium]